MKKLLFFMLGLIIGSLFLGNGFYTIIGTERNAYVLNKYTRNVFFVTPSKIEKLEVRE